MVSSKQYQQLALQDGYIWSVGLDTDGYFNMTVAAAGKLYWVYLDGSIIDSGYYSN